MTNELKEIELRKIIHQVLEEHTDIMYIPDIAPYILRKLGNAGFRRVGDNMIAIEKEEYYELMDKNAEKSIKQMVLISDVVDKSCKETAMEILKILKEHGVDKEIIGCCDAYDVNGIALAKEICEKYGVEVEE